MGEGLHIYSRSFTLKKKPGEVVTFPLIFEESTSAPASYQNPQTLLAAAMCGHEQQTCLAG